MQRDFAEMAALLAQYQAQLAEIEGTLEAEMMRLNVFKTDYRAWREYGDGVVDRVPDEDDYVFDDVEANPRTRVGG